MLIVASSKLGFAEKSTAHPVNPKSAHPINLMGKSTTERGKSHLNLQKKSMPMEEILKT